MEILYNTTFSLPRELEEKFVSYMQERYIPAILQAGVLYRPLLSRIVNRADESADVSYALQFIAPSREELGAYLSGRGRVCLEDLLGAFGSAVMGFVTMMELVPLATLAHLPN